MKNLILLLLLTGISLTSFGGELKLSGVYNGKNIFVQNAYNSATKEFCTNEVFVNGIRILSDIRSSAFSINLSKLKPGSPVDILITFKDDCTPKIINPHVLQAEENYKFEELAIQNDAIKWRMNAPLNSGKFILERFTGNYWNPIQTIATSMTTEYSEPLGSFVSGGLNKFRIKYLTEKNNTFLSPEIEYTANKDEISSLKDFKSE